MKIATKLYICKGAMPPQYLLENAAPAPAALLQATRPELVLLDPHSLTDLELNTPRGSAQQPQLIEHIPIGYVCL